MSSFEVTPFIHKPVYFLPHSRRDQKYPTFKAARHLDLSVELRLKLAFVWDDKDQFMNAAKDLPPPEDEDLGEDVFFPMYADDAVNCAAALINHDTSSNFNFNIMDTAVGRIECWDSYFFQTVSTPLHEAALCESVNIIHLLLNNASGHSPNTRIDYYKNRLRMKDVLPLDIALQQPWTGTDMERGTKNISIFRLICTLCDKGRSLETVRLLARKTKDLDLVFFKYMKDGRLPEMCMLLLAGCRPPTASLLHCRDDIPEKEKILELFEVFETIGDKLSAYVRIKRMAKLGRTAADVNLFFKDAGRHVKAEDIPSIFSYSSGDYGFPEAPIPVSKKVSVPRLLLPHALDALSYTNKGSSLVQGVRSYHKSSVLETGRNLASLPVKNKVIGDLNFQLYKHRAFFSTALRRAARLV